MTAKAVLLPCPFCGSTRVGLAKGAPLYPAKEPNWVDCLNLACAVAGPTAYSEADAIAAWNRRTPAPTKRTGGGRR
ncbi:MAG: Lar family restriction alleviation protein [Terriglobales bacterium]